MQKQAIFLMGPTAVGKTELAMQLTRELPVDLISVDSAMVYRGMDIGTGKPTSSERARYPHQLIDICDPGHAYSVAQFCADARRAMERSWNNDRTPLLVGGTMLYFKALQFGLSSLPTADPDLRRQLANNAQDLGWPAMHAKLATHDPETAQRLDPNDAQRIQRALEINILTQKTLAQNYAQSSQFKLDFDVQCFAIMPSERTMLHDKIASRFDKMLEAGLVAEVEHLYKRGDLSPELPAMRAVGYRQVWEYLQGKCDHTFMRERAIAATRQLAKRQYTWLRSWPQLTIFEEANVQEFIAQCEIACT